MFYISSDSHGFGLGQVAKKFRRQVPAHARYKGLIVCRIGRRCYAEKYAATR